MEKVILKTKDGLDIVGDYYNLETNKRGVLLLHMMPETKKSWQSLAQLLENNNFNVLAIDLRGHGESSGGPEGYKNFSDEDHQKSILDVETAVEFLKSFNIDEIIIGGASIGANLALWYASAHPEIKKILCLSPGINYRGIKPLDLVFKFDSTQRILIAASLDDIRQNGQSNSWEAKQIFEALPLSPQNKKLIIYRQSGHGTNMLYNYQNDEPSLIEEIIKWIKE